MPLLGDLDLEKQEVGHLDQDGLVPYAHPHLTREDPARKL
jgi:hypothetical protein